MANLLGTADLSDEDLMVRVQSDDSIAFAELYGRHIDRGFRVARAVGLDAGSAEETLEGGFAAIWRSRARFRADAGSFQAWLMTNLHSRAVDSWRRTTTSDAPSLIGGDGLTTSLGRLPEAQAEVTVLAFHGGLDHDEITTHLSLGQGPSAERTRLGVRKRSTKGP